MAKARTTEFDKTLGNKLKVMRINNRVSQEKLGEVLGVTFQQVQKYETGFNRISLERLIKVSKFFGVEPEHFYKDIEVETPDSLGQSDNEFDNFYRTAEAIAHVKAIYPLNKSARTAILSLARAISQSSDEEE